MVAEYSARPWYHLPPPLSKLWLKQWCLCSWLYFPSAFWQSSSSVSHFIPFIVVILGVVPSFSCGVKIRLTKVREKPARSGRRVGRQGDLEKEGYWVGWSILSMGGMSQRYLRTECKHLGGWYRRIKTLGLGLSYIVRAFLKTVIASLTKW